MLIPNHAWKVHLPTLPNQHHRWKSLGCESWGPGSDEHEPSSVFPNVLSTWYVVAHSIILWSEKIDSTVSWLWRKCRLLVNNKSSTFPCLCVGFSITCCRKNSPAMSMRALSMIRSSAEEPGPANPSGHVAWGRLKSPHRRMSGMGSAYIEITFLISSNDSLNSAAVERFPPTRSSGCLYTANISSKFLDLLYKPRTSTTPFENPSIGSVSTAMSSRK